MAHDRNLTLSDTSPEGRSSCVTLDPGLGYLVVINTYIVDPDLAQELLDLLTRATEEVLRFVDGFISANLHLSEDRKRLVNYAQWRSEEQLDEAGKNPNVRERMQAAGRIAKSFEPIRYHLHVSLPSASQAGAEGA